ncbi:MAG TPA: VWA domain-containing protein [Vicinamibacterales bacterium]
MKTDFHRVLASAIWLLSATIVTPLLVDGRSAMEPRSRLRAQNPPAGTFVSRSDLVVLHVVVTDRRGAPVPGLPRTSFTVLEDDRPQEVRFFGEQDTPVDAGLIVDTSGSMRAVWERVIAAAGAFAETSHPDDQIFALTFTEHVRPALPADAPFTSDPDALRAALASAIVPRGRTALYDAIAAGLDYVAKGAHLRKVLVLVSDGGDNASRLTFDEVLRRTLISNTVIYAVTLDDPLERDADPRRLKQLAGTTGGEAFRPRDTGDIGEAMQHIARDIRSAYTMGYVPANDRRDGRFRRIRVIVRPPDGRSVSVRTRQGYVMEAR